MPHDIFISYSRRDLAAVKPIKEELESIGFSCWMDVLGVETGHESFPSVIAPAIEGCFAFLFFLSTDSLASPWTLKEIAHAEANEKRIVPIRFDDTSLKTGAIALELQGRDIIDWRKPEQKAKLLRDLRRWKDHGSGKVFAPVPLDFGEALAQHLDKRLSWQKFRCVAGLKFQNGNNLLTAHVVASSWGLFILGYEDLPTKIATKPDFQTLESHMRAFATIIAKRCHLNLQRIQHLFVLPDNMHGNPFDMIPEWVVSQTSAVDFLNGFLQEIPIIDWEKNHRKITKDLESFPMTHSGRESNILKHFKAGTLEEIEDGAALLAWADNPSEQLLDASETACKALWRLGNGRAAEGVRAWFRVMADRENVLAMDHYGWLLEGSEEQVFWFRKAAELGGAHAQNSLGYCLQKGNGVRQDHDEALKWFKASAAQGNRYGQASLAGVYAGPAFAGLPPNWDEAFRLYRLSAEQEWHVGQYHLGVCYENGMGTPKNLAEALRWYEKAARQGDEDAQKALERLGTCRTIDFGMEAFTLRRVPAKGTQPAFWMGETQVTQALWTAVMGNNPSQFKGDDFRPVEMVSWDDCQDFLKRLNALDEVRNSGLVFRLPTAEEWEHACRAGSSGKYCRLADGTEITDATIDRVAWFDGNSDGTTHPVGRKEPNAWGLYDMHGNVGEWTQTATDDGMRKERGGSYFLPADCCLSSGFSNEPPSLQMHNLGFRICASDGN